MATFGSLNSYWTSSDGILAGNLRGPHLCARRKKNP